MPQDLWDQLGKQSKPTTPTSSPTQGSSDPWDTIKVPGTDAKEWEAPIVTKAKGYANTVLSSVAPVLDFLSRGQYASAKFFNSYAYESKGIIESLDLASQELIDPKDRLSFTDIIKKNYKEFSDENPMTTNILGFIGDVALDPTTYLGVGLAKSGIQVGGKTLSNVGLKAIQTGEKVTSKVKFFGKGRANLLDILDAEARQAARTGQDTFSAAGEGILKDAGYFDELTRRVEEITEISGKKVTREQAEQIAKDEIYKDIRKQYFNSDDLKQAGIDPLAGSKVQKVMYHGTSSPTNFDSPSGMSWFTSEAKFADDYAAGAHIGGAEGSQRVFPVRLDIKNPYTVKDRLEQIEKVNDPDFIKELRDKGYDGIIRKDENGRIVALPFNDNQVKSVFDKKSWAEKQIVELSQNEVRERVEQRIMRIADAIPEFKSFESKGLRLKVGLPFGKSYDIPKTQEFFQAIGVNRLVENIGSLAKMIPGATTTARTFNKYQGFDQLPEEFVDAYRTIENKKDALVEGVIRDVSTLGKGIPHDRLNAIQAAMYKIDDETRIAEETIGRTVSQPEADAIKRKWLDAAKLDPKEMALVSSLYQGYGEMAQLEIRANLLRSNLANYTHREYQVIKDADEMVNLNKPANAIGTNTFLGSSQNRKFMTIAEAKAKGNVPEMNAIAVYAQRVLKHRDKMANAQFNDAVRVTFGLTEPGKKAKYGEQLAESEFKQLPKVVQSSIKMLGDTVYPTHMNEEVKNVLKVIDTVSRYWRIGATVIKPSFGPKQAVSNTLQAAMVSGVKAFKSFDPRAAMDATLLLFDRGKETKQLPKFLNDLFNKGFGNDATLAQRLALSKITGEERLVDYAKDFKLRSALGTEYTGEEIIKMAREDGVIKGFDATGTEFKRKIDRALLTNTDSIGPVAKELSKWMLWPSHVEDYSRMMLYMNGLRMGYSSKESVKLVNKALFDYGRGLSHMEKSVFRRVLPFYTYSRFAIPFALKTVAAKPGNAATANKVVGLMEKLFEGEPLTPAERDTFGTTYLVEQPRVYKGLDKEGKAGFNVFNSMTPFDVLSIMVSDKKGNLDIPRTIEKSILGAMTPFLKVPLEQVMNKQFFSGRTLESAGKLGELDKEGQITNVLPSFVKEAIGWENRVHPKTGKTSVYVNPYMAHIAGNAVPGLRSFLNLGDGSQSALERTMDLLFGIKSVKVDLKETSQWNTIKDKKEIADLKARIRSAKRKGSENEYEKAHRELKEFMQSLSDKKKLEGEIRGQGMNTPTGETPTEPALPNTQSFK